MATSALRLARPVRAEVVRHMRRHDLVFYAAGLTFYAAIAVVPLLLVAWFVTSLVLGTTWSGPSRSRWPSMRRPRSGSRRGALSR
jgi:uncharacterized BrkB/YihY/UPF0761 family membrane protein